MSGVVRVERQGPRATLTIDNPAQRNALTPAMLDSLPVLLAELAADGEVRVATLRGAGGTFSSGYAVDRFPTPDELDEVDEVERACQAVEQAPFAVVAVIEGTCVGAALDLACACDVRLALPGARVGITPAKMGLVYGWQGARRVQRVAGPAVARRLLLTAELVGAEAVAEPADEAAVEALVAAVAANAPRSIAGAKRVFAALDDAAALSPEASAEVHRLRREALGSADCAEARAAFAERRRPEFTGR